MQKLITIIIAVTISVSVFAQKYEKIIHQAGISDRNYDVVMNKKVSLKISIIQGVINGETIYSEIQDVITDKYGTIRLLIGGESGYDNIDWSNPPYYIKTETDPDGGTNRSIVETRELSEFPALVKVEEKSEKKIEEKVEAEKVEIEKIRKIDIEESADTTVEETQHNYPEIITTKTSRKFSIRRKNIIEQTVIRNINAEEKAELLNYINDLERKYEQLAWVAEDPENRNLIKDIENNRYRTLKIGNQVWMAENLRTTKYNNGTDIPVRKTNNEWNQETPGYCWYNNDYDNHGSVHGALYNWYAIDPESNNNRNICPNGWRVPSDNDWIELETYVHKKGYNYDDSTDGDWESNNKYAKALAATVYCEPSGNMGAVGNTDYPEKRNATGFSALMSGFRIYDGNFFEMSFYGCWWTSTEGGPYGAWYRALGYGGSGLGRSHDYKKVGFSVRCMKDNVKGFEESPF